MKQQVKLQTLSLVLKIKNWRIGFSQSAALLHGQQKVLIWTLWMTGFGDLPKMKFTKASNSQKSLKSFFRRLLEPSRLKQFKKQQWTLPNGLKDALQTMDLILKAAFDLPHFEHAYFTSKFLKMGFLREKNRNHCLEPNISLLVWTC